MHRSTRHDATLCSSWTRQLDAFRTAHLHHFATTTPPVLANYLSALPFRHLHPGRTTTGRRLLRPIRRPRSSFARVYTVASPGQPSALFEHAGSHRKLPGRHAPPRRPFLQLRTLRRPRTSIHPILGLHRPRARRPLGHIIFSVNSDPTFRPSRPFHRAPTDAPRLRRPCTTRQHPCGHRRNLSHRRPIPAEDTLPETPGTLRR